MRNASKLRGLSNFIFLLLLFVLSFLHLLFAFRTNLYFSVDDFRVLEYFKDHGVLKMIIDFLLHGDMFGYRKFIGYIFFGTLFEIFKVNPAPYIILMFLIHTLNLFFLFFILKRISSNDFVAFFLSVLFNRLYLFYFSNIHEISAALFCLISIFLFLKYPKNTLFSLIFYVLALFSKELSYSLPFAILAISYIKGINVKKSFPFFIVLFLYALYQSYFLFVVKSLSFVKSYGVTFDFANLVSAISFYVGWPLIFFLCFLPILFKDLKPVLFLLIFAMTIFPVMFFGARRELYYLYIPSIYLSIYISLFMRKIDFKTILVCLVLLFLFGGRSVFPKIAWHVFPNWQKVSIENVVKRVEGSLVDMPSTRVIDLSDLNLERDARLMLAHNVLDLFINESFSGKYAFMYNSEEKSVLALMK